MKIIYVAGPYRATTEWGVAENIHRAEMAAIELWKKGWAVFCPHKNTAFFGGACEDSTWLKGDMEILRWCDAICLIGPWGLSQGCIDELNEAKRIGIEVYFKPETVPVLNDGVQP